MPTPKIDKPKEQTISAMLTAAWHTFFSDYAAMTLVAVFVPGLILALINLPQQILGLVSGYVGGCCQRRSSTRNCLTRGQSTG
jgi:hypothetical protein